MIICENTRASEITKQDEDIWRDFCSQHEYFKSPLLSPDFFYQIAKVRDDAFVAIYRENGKPIAFLAHHKRPNNFARPIGAPFSDYSALICAPDCKLRMQDALKLAQIKQFQAIGFIDPYNLCDEFGGEEDDAHGMDLLSDEPAHSTSKKHRKNVNRLRRHLEDNIGTEHFIFDDTNQSHFDEMIALKREQTLRTGVHDFLAPQWVQQLMKNLFEAPRDGLHGSLLTMMAGDMPIAWQFGPRLGDRMHPWIFTYLPQYAQYSPGQIYLMDCADALKEKGVAFNDLSTGTQSYKSTFCNKHFKVKHGTIFADGTIKKPPSGKIGNLIARFSRRFDQIACLELETSDRIKGALFAIKSAGKRIKA